MAYLTKVPGKGAFSTITAGSKKVPGINQDKEEDCGPSCIGLVLRMTGHAQGDASTPASLRSASQGSSGKGYRPSAKDAIGAPATSVQQSLALCMREFANDQGISSDTGTFGDNMASTLQSKFGFANAKCVHGADLKAKLRATSFARPLIVHVGWEGGGGHWVVVCGHDSKMFGHGSYLFSDPFYGVGWLQIPREDVGGNKQPTYRPSATARGHLTGWYISL